MTILKNTLLYFGPLITGMGFLASCNQSPAKHVEVLNVTYKANASGFKKDDLTDTLIFSVDTAFKKVGNHLPVNDTLLIMHSNTSSDVNKEPKYFIAFCYDKEEKCAQPQVKAGQTIYQFREIAQYMKMKKDIDKADLYYGFTRKDRFKIVHTPNIL
jgi:hypothetical protein